MTDKIFSAMEEAALLAAQHLIKAGHSNEMVKAWRKGDNTWVMSLDLECEKIILEKLSLLAPALSEESDQTHSLIGSRDPYFVIDPVDGTTACKRYLTSRGGQVGFGPVIGYLEEGRLRYSVFYNVPYRTLFSAVKGEGTYSYYSEHADLLPPPLLERPRLKLSDLPTLEDSVALFFMGRGGEGRIVNDLKVAGKIDNAYRFGGFANDCSRLARGLEDIQVQFAVKPWDFAAALLSVEAGLSVVLDPLGTPTPFDHWNISMENPLITCPAASVNQLLALMREIATP